jgi:hypothetical protein
MLNDLPAGDRGSFFRFQGGKKFLIQNWSKLTSCSCYN